MADDLGYGDLGCYGQKLIKTPRLDQMAKEGMKFTRFYSGSTVCAPSRSVLMTGQHMGHTHVRGNAGGDMSRQSLRDIDLTVAEKLKETGYKTALIGKWGLGEVGQEGHPLKQGFDEYEGIRLCWGFPLGGEKQGMGAMRIARRGRHALPVFTLSKWV